MLGKIEEDQRDVNQKSIENDELQLKLVMCPQLPYPNLTYSIVSYLCYLPRPEPIQYGIVQ